MTNKIKQNAQKRDKNMKQDILHVRDALSKTFTVTDTMITLRTDLDRDEFVVPNQYIQIIEDMFQFAYNRADEFTEGKTGVSLNISGDQYDEEIGQPAQVIYELVQGEK